MTPPTDAPRRRLRIALADSHTLAREAIKRLIAAEADFEVIAEAADGNGACACHRQSQPDAVVLELALPGVDGWEATRLIKQARPATKVLAVTAAKTPNLVREFFELGGDGYVAKTDSAAALLRTLREVLQGEAGPSPEMLRNWGPTGDRDELSARELKLLRLVALGYSNKEIASVLEISTKTVETAKTRAMRKAQLASRVDIVRYGAERGWLQPM